MSQYSIPRNDSFILNYTEFSEQKWIIKLFSERRYSVDKQVASSRLINHWEKLNLLEDSRVEGKGWRKFTATDLIWIHLILELRNFGFSNEKILQVKKNLCSNSLNKETPSIENNLLLQYYMGCALGGKDIYVLIFENCAIDFATIQQIVNFSSYGFIDNHLSINFSNIFKKVFPKLSEKITSSKTNLLELKDSEMKLLMYLVDPYKAHFISGFQKVFM